jgi:hypothetical protein
VQNPLPTLRGRSIRFDQAGRACLNDIHRAAGFSVNQRPSDWTRLPGTLKLIEAVIVRIIGKSGNWTKDEMRSALCTRTGTGGGTFADVRLALAFAEYLNPKLALEVREVFLRYKAADATLADDILQRATAEANEWAGKRALGRGVRNGYTATLAAHGVEKPVEFAACTNATYTNLFDKPAKQLKAAKRIKGNLRDAMDLRELAYVMASEALSGERIEDQNCAGPGECRQATGKSARFIRDAIEGDRRDRRNPRLL